MNLIHPEGGDTGGWRYWVEIRKLHSGGEERFRVVGKTKKGRLLFVAFTKRKNKIRINSARDINKKEVYLYEKTT